MAATPSLFTDIPATRAIFPPLRIDLLTSIDGVAFDAAFDRRVEVEVDGVPLPFLSLEDLRTNKRASGRAQDLADVEALED